ncbi:hypothetical protein ACS126_03540 [Sphingobacterium lactis]|uniref:hypothetical protein n=1 Tax=Sphingobacterium TaxID=28453 RepID=UPI0021A8E205|nr:hypothetical protein [Sphingobacterium hotanense]MCT1526080.1 hypothetical protein [Sphingobacterium hotanense]
MKALQEMNATEKAYLLATLFPDVLPELTQLLQAKKDRDRKQLTDITTKKVETTIDKLFVKLHRKARTKSGDITPEQQAKLEDIQYRLIELIVEQIMQNLHQDI